MTDQRLCLTIGDITIAVVSSAAEMVLELESAQERFQAEDARPDLHIQATFGHTAPPHDPPIFDTNGVWRVYCRTRSYRFALYLLEHGDTTRLTPLSSPQAVARLFTMSLAAFYSQDAVAFTLSFINGLVDAVPCFELPFVPDNRVVDLVLGSPVPEDRQPANSILSDAAKRQA